MWKVTEQIAFSINEDIMFTGINYQNKETSKV